ncbi:SUMF1/EgtB/PvdO family nonheme iron enzyme, partial [Oscillochloris sp. ZM17-4]|uniref:NACHT domain-containing protein n=1 Tax=Oscillochloris sp. ZM17-4 TaxID=2866714 RepID=UPI001C72DEE0
LASNPLLLTMIATVHRYLLKLPEKRAELYKEIFEVFLGRRQKVEDGLVVLQKLRVLGPLAYRMMHRRDPQIGISEAVEVIAEPLADVSVQERPADFLKRVEESSGLLLEIAPGVYKFAHLTYQEYLASVYILRQHLEPELINYVDDTWWHETILLAAAQEDASDVLEAALDSAGQSEGALSLGITILEEAISLRPEVRARFVGYMEDHVERGTPEQRTLIAEALLRYSLRQMAQLDERKQRAIGGVLISHPAYQRFLDTQRAQGHYLSPDHWLGHEFPAGQSKLPVLGVRLPDAIAFCAWLSERDRDGMRYRLPTVDESKSYRAGLDSRLRYWVGDGAERIYGERWATPQDRVRAILADHLFDDMHALQIFTLGLLIEQIRVDVQELGNWHRHALILPDEIATAQRLDDISGLIGALAQAISRSGRDLSRAPAGDLARVAMTIQDKARLAVERYTQAQTAAASSHESKDHARSVALGRLTDELRGEAREPVRMIGDLLKEARGEIALLSSALPAGLREGSVAAAKLREVMAQGGVAAMRSLKLTAASAQGDMLADVREHLYLIDIGRLPDLARAGYTCLDVAYAAEFAQVFDRAGSARPARAPEERVFLRYWALINCLVWISREPSDRSEWTREQRTQGLRSCRQIYVDLVVLEERVAGRMPPVEGIRLVREPRDG